MNARNLTISTTGLWDDGDRGGGSLSAGLSGGDQGNGSALHSPRVALMCLL
jgi:hypothetical protein